MRTGGVVQDAVIFDHGRVGPGQMQLFVDRRGRAHGGKISRVMVMVWTYVFVMCLGKGICLQTPRICMPRERGSTVLPVQSGTPLFLSWDTISQRN